MEWKRIQTELRRLESLVDGWAAANRISTLERDLALDKLKALYEELRFADAVVADGSDEVPDAAAFAPEPSIRIDLEEAIAPFGDAEELSPTAPEKETVEGDPPQEAAGPRVAAPEPEKPLSEQLVREGLVPQPDAAAEAVRTEEARPDAQNAQTVPSEPGERGEEAGRSVEAAVLSAGTSAQCAADAEQAATEGSRSEATAPERREPVLNSLFDLDDLVDRRRKNRRVILSLYESEEEDVRPAAPERHKEKHGTDRSERRDMRRAADSSAAGPDPEKSVSPQPFTPVGEGAASAADAGMSAAGKVEGTSETRPESAPETMPHARSEQIRPEIGLDDDAKCGAESSIPTALEPSSPNGNAREEVIGAGRGEGSFFPNEAAQDAGPSFGVHPVPERSVAEGASAVWASETRASGIAVPDDAPVTIPGAEVPELPRNPEIPAAGIPAPEASASEVPTVDPPVQEAPGPAVPAGEPQQRGRGREEGSQQVLADVIGQGVQTLADRIAAPLERGATLAAGEPVDELRGAIGVNDRFLLIRDLFAGDAAAYERAIDRLEEFDDLDDCMIHIAENYAWNPNSDGARLLTDLLERKLG
ncbi:hypothetical protein [Alistipes sp.]|uniref:hypothetical protein n=1 Tax=Alistipes sp. TaxID=1872444 RepID=UPI003AB72AF9